jgi:hypothetical protein
MSPPVPSCSRDSSPTSWCPSEPTTPGGAALRPPLIGDYDTHHDLEATLEHHGRVTGWRMAAELDHVEGPTGR